jgi:hypothetical protein
MPSTCPCLNFVHWSPTVTKPIKVTIKGWPDTPLCSTWCWTMWSPVVSSKVSQRENIHQTRQVRGDLMRRSVRSSHYHFAAARQGDVSIRQWPSDIGPTHQIRCIRMPPKSDRTRRSETRQRPVLNPSIARHRQQLTGCWCQRLVTA